MSETAVPIRHLSRRTAARGEDWRRLARLATRLSVLSLLWLSIEGALGIVAGVMAGSVALIAFGFDSAIEGLASVAVIWRFSGGRLASATVERRAQRGVAISFFLLAPYVAAEAIHTLLRGALAHTSWLGIGLTAGTIVICPWLGFAKRKLAGRLGSGTVSGEGMQNILCAAMAAGVLLGLLANALWGLWWVDPVVAIAIAALCVREGRKAWQGGTCACAACALPEPPREPTRRQV